MAALNKNRCYLFGAIDRAPDRGYGWRIEFAEFLESLGIITYNPLSNDGNSSKSAYWREKHKKSGDWYNFIPMMENLAAKDFGMLNRCDFAVGYIDINIPMCGTYMELQKLVDQNKPRLIVCKQGIQSIPDFIFSSTPVDWMFPSFDDLKLYLTEIDSGIQRPLYDKFLFFG